MTYPIQLNLNAGKNKPFTSKKDTCPFCSPDKLTHILEKEPDLIWLMNKYPILTGTWPTVIIESLQHDLDLTNYSAEKLHSVITFGMNHWLDLSHSGRFKSVIYFRNHGPHSGGSLAHPHSQIMGLYNLDYRDNLTPSNFRGPVFFEQADCQCSISSLPIGNITEFNVMLKKDGHLSAFADCLQKLAQYLKNDFLMPVDSYNIFFYEMDHIYAKVFPRFTSSPLCLGYKITPVLEDSYINSILKTLRSPLYFGD